MAIDTAVEMTALETFYRGCHFRSRTEARWAVFFDRANIPWRYEVEGYQLGSTRYLPDFWLPRQECWAEIKGRRPDLGSIEDKKAAALAQGSGKMAYLFFGDIWLPFYEPWYDDSAWAYFPNGTMDQGYWWCECPDCGAMGIEFEGRSDRLPCKQLGCPTHANDKTRTPDSDRLLSAYAAARQARFGT